jgi:hypothetical protein
MEVAGKERETLEERCNPKLMTLSALMIPHLKPRSKITVKGSIRYKTQVSTIKLNLSSSKGNSC